MTLLKFFKLSASEIEKAQEAYVNQIVQVSRPLAIYLFGSMAKGNSSVESDIDLLSIYETVALAKAAQREVWRQKSPYPIAADLIFIDRDSWEQRNRYSPLLEQIRSEGKLLYRSPEFEELAL